MEIYELGDTAILINYIAEFNNMSVLDIIVLVNKFILYKAIIYANLLRDLPTLSFEWFLQNTT